MSEALLLLDVLEALDVVGIPYMLVGSFASNYWGRPRMTHDADVVVQMTSDQAAELARRIEGAFYAPEFALRQAAALRGHANAIHLEQGFKVDLWLRKGKRLPCRKPSPCRAHTFSPA